MKKTNHDLHIMLVELSSDVKYLVSKSDALEKRQIEHEKEDKKMFASLNRYGASIALVSSAIGAASAYMWQKLTGGA